MDIETNTNILAVGVAYVILGALLRVIIILTMVMIIRSTMKDKKKKKKVTLEIKNQNTKLFIGYVAGISFLYFAVIDIYFGFDQDFNSLIWLGLFIVEITIMLPHLVSKVFKITNKQKSLKVKKGI